MPQRQGFTLIEVLIVMVVIAVLAGLGLSGYRTAQNHAHLAVLRADLSNLHLQQQLYFHSNASGSNQVRQAYAASIDEAALAFSPSSGVTIQLTVSVDGSAGWSALATHAAFGDDPDRACAIFIGQIEPVAPATQPGQIACHRD